MNKQPRQIREQDITVGARVIPNNPKERKGIYKITDIQGGVVELKHMNKDTILRKTFNEIYYYWQIKPKYKVGY